ncbi:hypothetical protein SBOR_1610 [Sclerotinia borealis F-4128]|uniref:DNA repair protein Swi5/Sae3 n=1 Tax=Sclerotinia borealis (strain F-4128) TaxID=1432307 RepID=W9CMH8_SCLBF|nr:hypothetical protein SBOR_1610 [Sclerotinia borealis F-4128]
MDGGILEMDLGMDLYEEWDWQRFREAESMELEDEDEGSVMQLGMGMENGEEVRKDVRERMENGERKEDVGETEEVYSRRNVLPQYDGMADDTVEGREAASISKMVVDDFRPRSRQMVLPQYDGLAEEPEEAISTAKTRAEDVDVSLRVGDTTAFTSLSDNALGNSEVQEQSATLKVVEANREENHLDNLLSQNYEAIQAYIDDGEHPPEDMASERKAVLDQKKALKALADNSQDSQDDHKSERHDGGAEHRGDREMILDGDESISDFLGGETGDEDMVEIGESAITRESHKETSDSESIAIETASKLDPLADVDTSAENERVEEQTNNKIRYSVSGGEQSVAKKIHDDASSLTEFVTEMEVEAVVDEVANEVNDGPERNHGNVSILATAHSYIFDETEVNSNTDSHSETDIHAAEINTSGFLSNKDLRDLEGKPSSISTQDKLPVKFTSQDGSSDEIIAAMKDNTDESTLNDADMDKVPALTYADTQDSSITDHGPVNENSVEDFDLPSLTRVEATRQPEIPDSDAVTESSQQSPQKLSHIERTLGSAMKNTKNEEMPVASDVTGEDNEDKDTEGVESSFGRECATSSFDPKKHLNEPEVTGAQSLQNGSDDPEEDQELVEVATADSAEKVLRNSRAEIKDNIEVESPPTKSLPQKKTNKRGRPPGRKISGMVNNKGDDEGPIEKKAKLVEAESETPMSPDAKDSSNASSSVPEKQKRDGPSSEKMSTIYINKGATEEGKTIMDAADSSEVAFVDKTDMLNKQSSANETPADEFSPTTPAPEKRKRGMSVERKISTLSVVADDGGDIEKAESEVALVADGSTQSFVGPELTDEPAASSPIHPMPEKKRRGRPPGRKSSGLSPEKKDADEPSEDLNDSNGIVAAIPSNSVDDVAEPVINDTMDELTANSSSPDKLKRARPADQKFSGLSPKKGDTEEFTKGSSNVPVVILEAVRMEEATPNHISTDGFDTVSSSSVKRKRGRPPGRKSSQIEPEQAEGGESPTSPLPQTNIETRVAMTNRKSNDDLGDSSPLQTRKRGRPPGRKVSELTPQKTVVGKIAEEVTSGIAAEEAVNAAINESVTNMELADEPPVNSPLEKRKRGRPSRQASGLNTGSAIKERLPDSVDSASKNIPTENVDSDEEGDELQNGSPPAKKVKPEPKKRGRPPVAKTLDIGDENTKADEQDLTGEESTRAKENEKMEVDMQTRVEPPTPEKRKRGRPSATKARRISNSDSEVTEEEQQTSEKVELSGAENEELVEVEADEEEEPVIEKKKRGRPTLLKNKGKQTAKASERADDEDITMKDAVSTIGSSKGKVSGSQVSISSNTSSSSQRQDAFFAEMKAMKISSLQARNTQLRIEITQKREKVEEITEELEKPADETVKRHIKLLHDYNDIKDVGQGLVGMIADNRGVRVGELYEEFGVGIAD